MADVTPVIPSGRMVIESYGDMTFRVSGERYTGGLIVLPDRVIPWPVADWADVTVDSLKALTDANAADVLLLGCGQRAQLPSRDFRQAIRATGLVTEPMDTGAACRTYNVLMAEDRRVAAALLPVA